eukprot:2190949-Prymnesium_polylepis.4
MACKALDYSAAVWKSAGEHERRPGSESDGSERTLSALFEQSKVQSHPSFGQGHPSAGTDF